MEIVRNGQKILLTDWELFQAYEEQKYLYLKESVLENMEEYLSKGVYSKLETNEDYREKCIMLFQKYYEDYHMEYDIALKEAICDSAKTFLDTAKEEFVEEKGRNSNG